MQAVHIDSTNFDRMIADLMRLSGKDYATVLRAQVIALLKNCIRHTRAATRENITRRANAKSKGYVEFEDGSAISIWKKAGNAVMFLDRSNWRKAGDTPAPLLRGDKSWHQMDGDARHWSDERWARFQEHFGRMEAMAKKRLAAALASRGLARQSWLQIADDVGLTIPDVPGFVRNARPQNGRSYANGSAQEILLAAAIYIEIRNSSPIVVNKLNGAQILSEGLAAREAAFRTDIEHDVFRDIAQRAKRYPGIFTN